MSKQLLLLVALLATIPRPAYCQNEPSEEARRAQATMRYIARGWAHQNDVQWIHFGAGIIDACHSVQLWDGVDKAYDCNETDKNFPKIKEWLLRSFGAGKLNCSPNETHPTSALAAPRALRLYASSEPPNRRSSAPTHAERENNDANWLLIIPLTADVLGCDPPAADRTYKKILAAILDHKESEKDRYSAEFNFEPHDDINDGVLHRF